MIIYYVFASAATIAVLKSFLRHSSAVM